MSEDFAVKAFHDPRLLPDLRVRIEQYQLPKAEGMRGLVLAEECVSGSTCEEEQRQCQNIKWQ